MAESRNPKPKKSAGAREPVAQLVRQPEVTRIPFITSLSEHGVMASLLTMREVWTEDQFLQVLKDVGCFKTDAAFSALPPERQESHARNAPTRWYRDITGVEAFTAKLDEFGVNRAGVAGYDPSLLLTKRGTRASYRCLVETVHELGAVARELPALDPRVACAHVLARLSGAHFWTLYRWVAGTGGPRLVAKSGLRYPEALVGSMLVSQFVRRPLLTQPLCATCVDELSSVKDESDASSFATREAVNRCWAVQMRLSDEHLLLFLNWREEKKDEATAAHIVEPKLDSLLNWRRFAAELGNVSNEVHEEISHPRAAEARDLYLSIRYCQGWLASIDPFVQRTQVNRISANPAVVQRQLVTLFQEWLSPPRAGASVRTLKFGGTLVVNQVVNELLSDLADTTAESYSYDARERKIDLRGHSQMRDWRGAVISSSAIVLDPDKQTCLLQEGGSLVGQCIAWHASLLLPEVPAVPPGNTHPASKNPGCPEVPGERSLLRRKLWNTSRASTRSELAVPVFAGKLPLGAIGVEATKPNALQPHHLPPIEAVSLATGALYCLCSDKKASQEREWINQCFLAAGTAAPRDAYELWRVLTRWAIKRGGADCAFLVIDQPSAGWGGFSTPVSAVSVSEQLTEQLRGRALRYMNGLSSQLGREGEGLFSGVRGTVELAMAKLLEMLGPSNRKRHSRGKHSDSEPQRFGELGAQALVDDLFADAVEVPIRPNEVLSPLATLHVASFKPTEHGEGQPSLVHSHAFKRSIELVGAVVSSFWIGYTSVD